MKIISVLLLVIAGFIPKASKAQIDIPADSIRNILCHKWGFKGLFIGKKRINNITESITYEFFADSTLKRVSSNGKSESGTWTFKAKQKIIFLKIEKITLFIPVLSIDELIVLVGDGSPTRSTGATFFKRIKSN